jgi:flagella basal body P-ring formation protein FlgA
VKKASQFLICAILILFGEGARAGAFPLDFQEILKDSLKEKLGAKTARIEFAGPIRWTRGEAPTETEQVKILSVTARGEAQFVVRNGENSVEGIVPYSAWVAAKVATRRVMPGETLQADAFHTQEVNVASGLGYEFRGVVMPGDTDVGALEARQTILEGQFLASSAVRKTPDVRRGDVVRIHLISNGVTLSTLGIAEEAGYFSKQVRVMTQKTKRELLGELSPGRIVEVKL